MLSLLRSLIYRHLQTLQLFFGFCRSKHIVRHLIGYIINRILFYIKKLLFLFPGTEIAAL